MILSPIERASYSALLLVVGNLKHNTYSIIFPLGLARISLDPKSVECDEPFTFMVHRSLGSFSIGLAFLGSFLEMVHSRVKSVSTCFFIKGHGWKCKLNSINSSVHLAI